jgi:hypothetical protein
VTGSPFDILTEEVDVVDVEHPTRHARMCVPPGVPECAVGQDPPTGVDRKHKSPEARSLYPLALQLTHALRLRFVGRAT